MITHLNIAKILEEARNPDVTFQGILSPDYYENDVESWDNETRRANVWYRKEWEVLQC